MHRERGGGFTLIEVLVAFAVLSLLLAALLQIFSTGLRSTAAARDQITAASLAQAKLAVLGVAEPMVPGRHAGRFDNGFEWLVEAQSEFDVSGIEEASLVVWRISVTVRSGDPHRPTGITLNTLRLLPALSPMDRP